MLLVTFEHPYFDAISTVVSLWLCNGRCFIKVLVKV